MCHSHSLKSEIPTIRIPVKETMYYRNIDSENLEYKSEGNITFLYKNIYFCLILIFNDHMKIKLLYRRKIRSF